MQRDIERDLISAWQSGSLPAAEAFVRQRQTEVRTVAYLLTLDRNRARGLAHAAFVRFFRAAHSMNPDTDTRVELMVRLGRIFLRNDYEVVDTDQVDMFAGGPPQKFGVDNQRDRTMAALGRLEERERVALVLGEVAAFGPDQLNQVLERGNTALVAPVETARQRLRHSLDIPQGQPVRPALLDASFDGPRDDLWPLLEDDITRVHREQQRRGQLVTYGVVAGTILVALIAIVALFSNDLFNLGGDEPAATGDSLPTGTLEDIGTPAPTAIPPTPTPTPVPLPLADVPNLMLASEYSTDTGALLRVKPLRYDTEANEITMLDEIESVGESSDVIGQWITPDGRLLLLLREIRLETSREYVVIALDSFTLERQWETNVGSFALNPDSQYAIIPPLAVASNALYVARLDPEASTITMERYDLSDGSPGEPVELAIGTDDDEDRQYATVSLMLAPDETRLLVITHVVAASDTMQPLPVHLIQLSLPDMQRGAEDTQPFVDGGDLFSTWGASLTADGKALYRVSNGEPGAPLQVDFLDIESGARSAIMAPFRYDSNMPYRQITMFHSHDGYRMYLIDSLSGDVAAIHLTERRLERFFTIDMGQFQSRFGTGDGRFALGWSNILSMDGERLYVAASINTTQNRYAYGDATGVWVLDLSTWAMVDFWPVEGTVEGIATELDDGAIVVRSWSGENGMAGPSFRLGRVDGELVREELSLPVSDDATRVWLTSLPSLYRSLYGRSPAVDGAAPADLANYSTLPRLETETQDNVVAGVNTTITVRVFDPVSGNVLGTEREEVRFDPDSTITASLTLDGQQGQLLVLNQTEPGVYRADTSLPADGTWDISVSIIAPDGSTTSVPQAGTLVVAPTLTGSDGERYQFRVSFEPRSPTVGQEANFKIRLVNVESGAVVSENVTFDVEQPALEGGVIEELPERLSLSLGNPATYFGSRSIIAGQTSYGVWDGRITFQDHGTWTVDVRLQFFGIPIAHIPAGRVLVGEAE